MKYWWHEAFYTLCTSRKGHREPPVYLENPLLIVTFKWSVALVNLQSFLLLLPAPSSTFFFFSCVSAWNFQAKLYLLSLTHLESLPALSDFCSLSLSSVHLSVPSTNMHPHIRNPLFSTPACLGPAAPFIIPPFLGPSQCDCQTSLLDSDHSCYPSPSL